MHYYLNPLTMEAHMFLNSLETLGTKFNQIDEHLYDALEHIVEAIETFLNQQPTQIVGTENTQLITPPELAAIQRMYNCTQCKLDLGNNVDIAVSHLIRKHILKRSDIRKEKREKRLNMVQKLPKKTKSLMTSELPKVLNDNLEVADMLKQIPDYDIIEKDLMTLITPLFPNSVIKLYKFGSRISGIGTRNSDLDIFVDIGNVFNFFEDRPSDLTLENLTQVGKALGKSKAWQHLVSIKKSRVPILKVCHAGTGIECDIGFSNSLGYCNTKLMEYLYELQPISRYMCIFLKKWLDRSKLGDNVSTYSMSLMVIFFLQLKKHLPTIEALQTDLDSRVIIGFWIGNFAEKSLQELQIEKVEISPNQCKSYLIQFFSFYANFDFSTHVVCPYFGQVIERGTILSKMPDRYTCCIDSGEVNFSGIQLKTCMVVQDPIQLNHNVTKAVTPLILKHFTDYFQQSAELLAELV